MNFFGENPVFYIGEFVYKKHGTFGPRTQNNLQLVYVYEGSASIHIEGKEHRLEAGRVALLLPGRREYFVFSKSRKTRHGWCESIRPQITPQILDGYKALPFDVPFTKKMECLASRALPLEGTSNVVEMELKNTLVQAMFWEYLLLAGYKNINEPPVHEAFHKAVGYIHAHYAKECDLGLLSKIAGVCEAHLIRLFKKCAGSTPVSYLWRVRLDSGSRLLRETGLSVSEISFRVGFQNPYHFSRLFTRRFGVSPRVYRKKAWMPHAVVLRDFRK